MRSLICLLLLAAAVNGQPIQLTEDQMDIILKPCIVYGANCPSDGSMGNYAEMKKELSMMKVGIALMGGRTPSECECDSGEQCDRECYYALMKVAVLELKSSQQKQKRWGRRKRTAVKVRHGGVSSSLEEENAHHR